MIEIDEGQLHSLLTRQRPEIEVGTLPHEVRKYFSCSRDTVFLSKESLRHIFERHGDHVQLSEILLTPKILREGLWLADHRPEHCIVSCQVNEHRYKLVVKVTKDRRRCYVVTFHRTAKRQTKALLKKSRILRIAW